MSRWMLRSTIGLMIAVTAAFLALYLLALVPVTRNLVSSSLDDRGSTAPLASEPNVPAASSQVPAPATDARSVEALLRTLIHSALQARLARSGPDINLGQEIAWLRAESKWQEGEQLRARHASREQADTEAQAAAGKAIQALEAALFSRPSSVEAAAKPVIAAQEDPAIKAMLRNILALRGQPGAAPGRYLSSFTGKARDFWMDAAYTD